jgi:hypothetical protein
VFGGKNHHHLQQQQQQQQQAQGLHLLSEAAMNNRAQAQQHGGQQHSGQQHSAHTSPSLPQPLHGQPSGGAGSASSPLYPAGATAHMLPSHAAPPPQQQQQQQQQSWYQPEHGHHHAGVSGGDDLQMPLDVAFDYHAQLGGLEGLDFGFPGLGVGADGVINGLFMESGPLWGMQSNPGTFMGGWPG